MSKGMERKKEGKKKPAKTLEEKRAAKKAKREARGLDTSFNPFDLWFEDEGRPDCGDWFAGHGWTTRTVNAREEAARLGREPQSDDRPFTNSFVTATKP